MTARWGPALGIGAMEQFGHLTLTIAENSEGKHADALISARRLLTVDPLGLSAQALPEIVEAAVRGGDPDLARSALARLEQRADASNLPWGRGLLARCRAMTSDDDEAEGLYVDALGSLAMTEIRTEQARTHLLFGEWLRRRNRLIDARGQLRAAHTCFAAMGAHGFARRARRELRAAGDSIGASMNSSSDPLTPQEAQIAHLAADGATNKEIAAQLFLSEGTIEYHLAKVFRKLDLTSRRQLRRHFTSRGRTDA
jgi:DNA-binding CsgD family transcriptional regulator